MTKRHSLSLLFALIGVGSVMALSQPSAACNKHPRVAWLNAESGAEPYVKTTSDWVGPGGEHFQLAKTAYDFLELQSVSGDIHVRLYDGEIDTYQVGADGTAQWVTTAYGIWGAPPAATE